MNAVPDSKAPTAARAAFLNWLATKHPSFYAQVKQKSGLGDVAPVANNTFSQILNSATGLLSQYVASKEQLAQLKVNLARAKAGQMPLTAEQFAGGAMAPSSGLAGVPTWVWIVAGGGILWLVMSRD